MQRVSHANVAHANIENQPTHAQPQNHAQPQAHAQPDSFLGMLSGIFLQVGRGALSLLNYLNPIHAPGVGALVRWVGRMRQDTMRQPPEAEVLSSVSPVHQLSRRAVDQASVDQASVGEASITAGPPLEIEVLNARNPTPDVQAANNIHALNPSAKKEAILALSDQLLAAIDGYCKEENSAQGFNQLKEIIQHHKDKCQKLSVTFLSKEAGQPSTESLFIKEPSAAFLFTKELDQTVEVFSSVAETLNRFHQIKHPRLSEAERQENISLWVGQEKKLSEVQRSRAFNYTAQRPKILRQIHQNWHNFNRWSSGFGVMQKIFSGMKHAHSDYIHVRNSEYMQSALKLLNQGALNVDANLTTKADTRLAGSLDKIKSILQGKNWGSVALLDNHGKAAFSAVQALLEGNNSSITNIHQLRDQLRIVNKVLSQFSPQSLPSTHSTLNYWVRNTFQVYGHGQKPLLTLADGMALKRLVEPLLASVDQIASFSRDVGSLSYSLGLSSQETWSVDSFQKLFQVVRDLKPMNSSMDALGYLLAPCTSHATNLRHNLQQLHGMGQATDHSLSACKEAVLALGCANLESIHAKQALDTADQQFQFLNAFRKEVNAAQNLSQEITISKPKVAVAPVDVAVMTEDELGTEKTGRMGVRYQAEAKDVVKNDILDQQVLTQHGRMSALEAAHWGYLENAFPGQYSGAEQKNLYLLKGSVDYEKVKNVLGKQKLSEQESLAKEAKLAASSEPKKAAGSNLSWSAWSAAMSKSAQENFTYYSDVTKAIAFPDRSASPDLTWDQHLGQAIVIAGIGLGVVTGKLSWDALAESSLGALLPSTLAAGSWLGTGLNALRLASAVPALGALSVGAGASAFAAMYTLGASLTVRLANDDKRKADSFLKDAAIDANAVVIASEPDKAQRAALFKQRQTETKFFQQKTLGETLNLCAATKAALFNTAFMSFSEDDEVLSPFNILLEQCSDLLNQHSKGVEQEGVLSSPPANRLAGLKSEVKQQVIDGNFDQAFQSLGRIPDVNHEVKNSKVVIAREILRLAQLHLSNNVTCYIARAVREGREPNAVEREVVLAHLQSYKEARDAFASLDGMGIGSDKDLVGFNQMTHELAVGLKNSDVMMQQVFYHLKSPIEAVRTLSDQQWRAGDTTGMSRLGNKLQNAVADVHLRNFAAGYEKKLSQEIHHIERLPKQGATQVLANHGLHTLEVSMFTQQLKDYRPKGLYRVVVDHNFFGLYANEQVFSQVGCIDGSSSAYQAALRAGNAVLVFPGGTEEAIGSYAERNQLHVSSRVGYDGLQHKPRFGLIRDQLQFGSSIYPVLEPRAEDIIPSGTLDGVAKAFYSCGRQATAAGGNFVAYKNRPSMKVDVYVCPRIEPALLSSSRQGIEDPHFQSALQDQHRIVYNQMQSALKALDVFTPFQTVEEHKAQKGKERVGTTETIA